MENENPYKDMEKQIRKQLAIAMESEVWIGKSTQGSLSSILCASQKKGALDKIEQMLNELPRNYHALPELTKIYHELT